MASPDAVARAWANNVTPIAGTTHRRLFLRAGAALPLLALAGGCAFDTDFDHNDADAPLAAPLRNPVRVAWVFGSGGPRGFVHVGVIKALEELRLAPDLIVGASAGAMVGTLRAAGVPAKTMETLALELSPTTFARLAMGTRERLSGSALAEWVQERIGRRLLERLPIAIACVALRQRDRAVVPFTAGNAGVAVQASAAIEGQFAPVRIRGQRYVDPDWVRPLPVREARALGAERVVAIDASAHEDRAPSGAEAYREDDLRKRALIRPDAVAAELVLHPDFGYWVSLSRAFRERAIEAGYRATMAEAPRLIALHRA